MGSHKDLHLPGFADKSGEENPLPLQITPIIEGPRILITFGEFETGLKTDSVPPLQIWDKRKGKKDLSVDNDPRTEFRSFNGLGDDPFQGRFLSYKRLKVWRNLRMEKGVRKPVKNCESEEAPDGEEYERPLRP